MKQKMITGMMLLLMGVFCLASCGKDDEEDQPQPQSGVNVQCVGTWSGWMHLKTNFIDKDYTGDTFALTIGQDGTLTAVFKDTTWGTATISGINATQAADGSFTLSSAEGKFVMNDIRSGGTQEFACKLESATLSADKKALEASISSFMEQGHGNMLFAFHTGEKPAE